MPWMGRVVLCVGSCKRPSQLPAHSRRHLPADATIPRLIGRVTISIICIGVTIPLRAGSIVDERRRALDLAVHNIRQHQHRQLRSTTRPFSIPASLDTHTLSPPSALPKCPLLSSHPTFRHTHLILQMVDLFIGRDRHIITYIHIIIRRPRNTILLLLFSSEIELFDIWRSDL